MLLFFNRFHKGDVLITTATGVMSEEEGEKWGLVPTHAYAVLDIREHKVPSKTEHFVQIPAWNLCLRWVATDL